MELVQKALYTIFHLNPQAMNSLADYAGGWLYVVIFTVIFAETGLVAVPFLPGDSLLFAVGAVAAAPGSPINLALMAILLVIAAVVGDALNYWIGYKLGPKVFASEKSWILNKRHLLEAQRFYERHGGKTIILARFVPIVRTFAPFVAGIGRMKYRVFFMYNVIGGAVWVILFLLAGWWFGGRAIVQRNFTLVILAIVVVSVLPMAVEFALAFLRKRRSKPRDGEPPASPLEPAKAV
jgi:membrane-associated protein